MKCSTCGKYITKLTNKFYRKYGSAISYHPYTKKIKKKLTFCSMKCLERYKEVGEKHG